MSSADIFPFRNKNKQTEDVQLANEKAQKELDRAFYLWIEGKASKRDAEMCMNYLQRSYVDRPLARMDAAGTVDPMRSAMAMGAHALMIDIKKRYENGMA